VKARTSSAPPPPAHGWANEHGGAPARTLPRSASHRPPRSKLRRAFVPLREPRRWPHKRYGFATTAHAPSAPIGRIATSTTAHGADSARSARAWPSFTAQATSWPACFTVRPHLVITCAASLSPLVNYHGLGRRHRRPRRFLMRPLLNGVPWAGVRRFAGGVGFLGIALSAACCTPGCGGDVTRPDLAAPTVFERSVLTLCGFEPGNYPLAQGLRSALEKGQATFDPEAAARCIGWLEEHGCLHADGGALAFFVLRLPGICRLAYTGHVAVGDPCTVSVACLGDAYCRVHSETWSTCEPRSPPTSSCQTIDACSVSKTQVPNCLPDAAGTMSCLAEP
jgi:hypothetical protein